MRVGPLRHLIVIEEITQGKDSAGGPTRTWSEHARVWASIKPIRGTERWYAHEKHSTATHEIVTRHIGGVDTKMRIKFGSRVFEISDIQNIDEKGTMLRIIATEEADHDR